ncbi:MAG: QueT transporter family protein [Erysipelotrichaceae bacterium]|nr:QueT transporter family protein [Erysipelotrichaceae bacterium]
MNNLTLKNLLVNGLIAATYAALTILIYPLSYGAIQMRISEIMVFLAFYNKKFIPGLTLGCLIANIPSTLGAMDMVFGTVSTLIVTILMYKIDNRFLAAFAGALVTGAIIGWELSIAFGIPFLINAFYVFVGEAIILAIGAFAFGIIEKNQAFINLVRE